MAAPANCVGGSEQGCVPANCGPHCGGHAVLPSPASWYPHAVGTNDASIATTKLGAGPEVIS
jgi:hypothetical protein